MLDLHNPYIKLDKSIRLANFQHSVEILISQIKSLFGYQILIAVYEGTASVLLAIILGIIISLTPIFSWTIK